MGMGGRRPQFVWTATTVVLLTGRCGGVASVSLATRGQTDMRGLVTAGRAIRLERFRWSRDRAWPPCGGCP